MSDSTPLDSFAGTMNKLSEQQKYEIVFYHRQGHRTCRISHLCKVSRACVRRWVKRWEETAGVSEAQRKKKCPRVGEHAARRARELLKEGTHGGLRGVSRTLVHEGFLHSIVSASTLSKAVKRQAEEDGVNLRVCRGKPKQRQTQTQRKKRLQFVESNQGRNWDRVMFTDRKRFYFTFPGQSVCGVRWRESGEGDAVPWPTHPSCINVYGGITRWGTTDLVTVTGTTGHASHFSNLKGAPARSITAEEYKQVCHELLCEGSRLFAGRGSCEWVFQQDGDPTHSVAKDIVASFNQERRACVQLLQGWPGNSPDLNLIENVWSWVQAEVDKKGCGSLNEFNQALHDTFRSVPQTMLDNLWKSMPKRLHEVVEKQGHRTRY